jgi:UDP-N-acetylglucosamine 2-epimerase (non-hydrolysing)
LKKKVLFVLGTRPEAIKLSPLIRCMRTMDAFDVRVCATAQHRAMLDQVLERFEVNPDFDLNLMTPGQTLAQITARAVLAMDSVLSNERFGMMVIQGDTTTALASGLAAFYRHVPVAHVEAGLRTGDLAQPFPEELNRVLASRFAALHFAPTAKAQANLLAEGASPDRIFVTGNTGIDAVLFVAKQLADGKFAPPDWPWLDRTKRLIVVTAHRRESFGKGIEGICDALETLAGRDDVQVVYPVHRNPNVLGPVTARLQNIRNVVLLEPLDYVSFVALLQRASLILTDSGGIQEEAPSLGKPVLVLRDNTERPEAVEAGTVKLVGSDPARIAAEAVRLLECEDDYNRMARRHNPYGDGHASKRIASAILEFLSPQRRA